MRLLLIVAVFATATARADDASPSPAPFVARKLAGAWSPPSARFGVYDGGRWKVVVADSGEVEIAPGTTMSVAARAFWEAVGQEAQSRQIARLEAELARLRAQCEGGAKSK